MTFLTYDNTGKKFSTSYQIMHPLYELFLVPAMKNLPLVIYQEKKQLVFRSIDIEKILLGFVSFDGFGTESSSN